MKLPRRRVVKAAVAAGLVAAGGVVAVVRTRGYEAPGRALVAVSPWQYAVLQHVARRFCAPDRDGVPDADAIDVAGFCDRWIAEMSPVTRKDLLGLLGYVEHVLPVTCGLGRRFTALPVEAQDRALSALERSSVDLLRGGFQGLKALIFLGYYRDPRTWSIAGYDGPLVRRPARGWWP